MAKQPQFSLVNAPFLAALFWALTACNPCGKTKLQPIELRVDALQSWVFALSNQNEYHAFYSPNDTLALDTITEWYVQLAATGQQVAQQRPSSWHLFPQAVACDPVPPLVFTQQQPQGLQVFTSAALNAQFPAGSAVTELFYTSPRANEGWSLDAEIGQHGMRRLIDVYGPLSYFLRSSPGAGTISQFTFELYLDADTLRATTPFIRF